MLKSTLMLADTRIPQPKTAHKNWVNWKFTVMWPPQLNQCIPTNSHIEMSTYRHGEWYASTFQLHVFISLSIVYPHVWGIIPVPRLIKSYHMSHIVDSSESSECINVDGCTFFTRSLRNIHICWCTYSFSHTPASLIQYWIQTPILPLQPYLTWHHCVYTRVRYDVSSHFRCHSSWVH